MDEYYLLGRVPENSANQPMWAGQFIMYRAADRCVAIAEGYRPHDGGSVNDLATWFSRRPARPKIDGSPGFEYEPPGWFERLCTDAGCAWFLPLAHRIASGSDVSLTEIADAYLAHNKRVILRGTLQKVIESTLCDSR